MIKSRLGGRGKIYAGDTPLYSDIKVEQTGPLQLTIRGGKFVTSGDVRAGKPSKDLNVAEHVLNFEVPAEGAARYSVVLAEDEGGNLYPATVQFEEDLRDLKYVQVLVLDFELKAGDTELPDIDVVTVEPGFPPGKDREPQQVHGLL